MKEIVWRCRSQTLTLGQTTCVMGILNVTPDSFSDGGAFFNPANATDRAIRMLEEGARIVDIGGESTRPGAQAVDAEEECRRVLPVVEALARRGAGLISVDTSKAVVAERALAAGAHIVNDVTALTGDPAMLSVVRRYGAGVVLMHMQGSPRTMQADPRYDNVVADIKAYLAGRLRDLTRSGLDPLTLAVDPGICFGKTVAHNLDLLRHLEELAELDRPILVGASRKSFLGKITGRDTSDRLAASLAAHAFAVLRGAHLLRVHDVKESCDLARILDTLKATG